MDTVTETAAGLIQMIQPEGLRYEDLDPASRSLANNYTGFEMNDDDEVEP